MAFKFEVKFDAKGLESNLSDRFGEGSDAQYEWSRIVYDGSRKYMPMVTSNFINISYAQSEPLFDQGELVYSGPMGHYLWNGELYVDPETKSAYANRGVTKIKDPQGRQLDFNKELNPLATARWTEAAANDNYSAWVNDLQGMIDKGKI